MALFSIVGFAFYGLPFFYDFFVRDLGWTRQQVTSGNAYSKLLIGPLFGFLAGWFIDRFGPRRLMLAGILMAGGAMSAWARSRRCGFFYLFYLFNALGYVCGGPLPNQVLLSRWFDKNRGKAMGFAYLGIGVGGTVVPLLAYALTERVRLADGAAGARRLMIADRVPAGVVRARRHLRNVRPQAADQRVADPDPARCPRSAPVLKPPPSTCCSSAACVSIGAVGGTMQNLKLFLSLDREAGAGRGRADPRRWCWRAASSDACSWASSPIGTRRST